MATINQIQVNGTIYDIEVDSANVSGTVANATTATKVGTADKGSATQPIYLKAGVPTATTYTLGKSVPADAKFTDTTYSNMTAATASAAGKAGLVPAPAAGAQAKFLRGDGTWQTPTNTTYSAFTGATSSAAGKAGLVPQPTAGQQAAFLRGDGTWAAVNVNLISVGTTQPANNTGYVLWVNTNNKQLFYRASQTSSWLNVASVWS